MKNTTQTFPSPFKQGFAIEFILIAIAYALLFFKVTAIMSPVAVLVLLYVILRCNIFENIFSFMFFLPNIAGYYFNPIGIPHVGGIVRYLGLALLLALLVLRKGEIKSVFKGLVPLLVMLALFVVSVVTTSGGDHAVPKLYSTIRHGIMWFLAFAFMYSNQEKFNFSKLGMFFIVLAIFLIPLSLVNNGIAGPSGLFDFSFLRYQTHEDFFVADEELDFHISYQGAGFLLLQGLGVFMIDTRKYKLPLMLFILGIITLSLLYVGSRQAIVSIFVISIVWAVLNNRGEKNKTIGGIIVRLLIFFVIIGVSLYVIEMLTAENGLFYSVVDEGFIEGGGRGDWLLSGMQQFSENPIWGVGFGRYKIFGRYGSYPHNMFVELLCETGLFGFGISVLLAIVSVIRTKKAVFPFIFLWMAAFLRSMASEELSINILVFVILFALTSVPTDSSQSR